MRKFTKNITLLIIALVCFTSIGQIKLESAVDEYYDGTTWYNGFKEDYQYDTNKNLSINTSSFWDAVTSGWIPSSKETYSYNTDNKVTALLYQDWNSDANQYENSWKDVYSYNSNGKIIEQIGYEWEDSQWINDYRFDYDYTNNMLSGGIGYEWDGSQWVKTDRTTLTYNGDNYISEGFFQDWTNSQWENSSKEVLSYNANNKIIENIYQEWNGTSWEDSENSLFEYDGNNNRIRETFGEGSNSQYKDEYTFDTSILMSVIAHPFKDKTGADYLFESYPYHNKLTEKNSFNFNSATNSWYNNNRTTYNYDGTAGIGEFNLDRIKIYPNPTKGAIMVSLENNTIEQINVYNTLGKTVFTSQSVEFDLNSISSGVYFIEVKTESGKVFRERIIKN